MATDIGPKIGIQGEAEFRREIRNITESLKTLGTEMDVVTSEFVDNEKSAEALTEKNKVLDKTVEKLNEKLQKQKEMLDEATRAFGDADPRTEKWQQTVNKTTAELNKAEAQIKRNTDEMNKLGEAEEETGDTSGVLGEILGELGLSKSMLTMAAATGIAFEALKVLTEFLTDAIKSGAEYADNIKTLSTNYSLATDELQAYQYMVGLADTSMDMITGSIEKLTAKMDAARDGNKDAAKAFEDLGIQITNADETLRNANDVFKEAIDRLGEMESGTERDAAAQELFGKKAMDLNSIIELGSDGIEAYTKEAQEMGYILTNEELDALGAVDDSFQRLDKAMEAAKNQVAAGMAPATEELIGMFVDLLQAVDWDQFGETVGRFIGTTTDLIKPFLVILGNTIDIINDIADVASKAMQVVGNFTAALTGANSLSVRNLTAPTVSAVAASQASSSGRNQANGKANQPIQVQTSINIDSKRLAQMTYSATQAENARRGTAMVR